MVEVEYTNCILTFGERWSCKVFFLSKPEGRFSAASSVGVIFVGLFP